MKTILYIRHGESTMNRDFSHLVGGRSNHSPLTKNGPRQAKAAGRWLVANVGMPELAIISPAVRTQQTAEALFEEIDYQDDVITDDRLQELSQGEYEGRIRSEVYTDEVIERINTEGIHFSLPGGESVYSAGVRMMECLTDTLEQHTQQNVIIVVSHGLAIRSLVGYINGLSKPEIDFGLKTPNCSLTEIEQLDTGELSVVRVGLDIVRQQLEKESNKA